MAADQRASSRTTGSLPRRPASLLTSGQRRLLLVTLALSAFILANTLYLLANRMADALDWRFFADADTAIPKLFQIMLVSHTGIGLLIAALMLLFAAIHLPTVWKRLRARAVVSGVLFVLAGLSVAITGLFIMTAAASRDNSWAWWIHVVGAGLVPILYGLHRGLSFVPSTRRDVRRFGVALASVLAMLLVGHSFSHRGLRLTAEARLAKEQGHELGSGAKGRIASDYSDAEFVPAGFVPPESPFFPSPATTTTGGFLPSRIITQDNARAGTTLLADLETFGFVVNTKIGAESCDRCHPDIVEQWSRSAHRFASFNNPFYEATVNLVRDHATEPNEWITRHIESFSASADRVGMIKSKWCSACHDPSLMLAGKMTQPVDRNTPEAQAGLTCLACHAIDSIHDQTGNGNYNIADEQEDPYLFADAPGGTLRAFLHDIALKAKPTVHKRQLQKDFFHEADYCATCHKVSLDVPVNNYRWLRGQNEFDNWHDSGVSLNASRTFYLPPSRRVCQDCHMPFEPAPLGDVSARGGMVRSHRFLAINTALPFIRGDTETIERIEMFLRAEKLSVDVFAITPGDADAPIMAVDKTKPRLIAGEPFVVDIVVRNKGVGHTFPGGTNDSNEGWLEVSLLDEAGDVLAISGFVRDDGYVDPAAHVYKAILLDPHGQPIDKRNAQDIRTTALLRVIGPGTADVAHFAFTTPDEHAGRRLTVRARLLWRKFDRAYTEFAFNANPQGFRLFDRCPDLPITEIAADEVSFDVVESAAASTSALTEVAHWIRYNDYGIGLLLQGDTRGAAQAFESVSREAPDRLDGPRNLARVAIRDGNLELTYDLLRRCERLAPADAQTAWLWGVALQADGRYEEAVMAYSRVVEIFPEDRAAWRNMGLSHRLNGNYEHAILALDRVLAIDPEDRAAHYQRFLCLRSLGRAEEAGSAIAAYERYQIDESAQQLTQAFRLANRGVNLETQAIHVHEVSNADNHVTAAEDAQQGEAE